VIPRLRTLTFLPNSYRQPKSPNPLTRSSCPPKGNTFDAVYFFLLCVRLITCTNTTRTYK